MAEELERRKELFARLRAQHNHCVFTWVCYTGQVPHICPGKKTLLSSPLSPARAVDCQRPWGAPQCVTTELQAELQSQEEIPIRGRFGLAGRRLPLGTRWLPEPWPQPEAQKHFWGTSEQNVSPSRSRGSNRSCITSCHPCRSILAQHGATLGCSTERAGEPEGTQGLIYDFYS